MFIQFAKILRLFQIHSPAFVRARRRYPAIIPYHMEKRSGDIGPIAIGPDSRANRLFAVHFWKMCMDIAYRLNRGSWDERVATIKKHDP